MSRVKAVEARDGGGWEVWISLGNEDDPRDEAESFIVGSGPTKLEAINGALEDLADNVEALAAELKYC